MRILRSCSHTERTIFPYHSLREKFGAHLGPVPSTPSLETMISCHETFAFICDKFPKVTPSHHRASTGFSQLCVDAAFDFSTTRLADWEVRPCPHEE